ncbi:hypothetical protein P9112_005057 [Eukaryota sp. TZLM1-RC]
MPLADSDSDTDWNAQAKILPVRTSSSPSLNHSPHDASYARNSSQKNFHSKTDHCTRKNTQKPPLRSLRSVARSIDNSFSRNLFAEAEIGKSQKSISTFNSPIDKIEITEKIKPLPLKGSKKCSICGISGHNSRTCPEKQKREIELKSAQQILECTVPADAVVKGAENNVSDYQHLNASSAHSSSPSENSNFCCPFCKKDVTDSRNGRKLLFCTNCKAVDTVRPLIRIPVEISPASTIPFSMEMRNFTSESKNNKWNISSFWKYFARKNKNCFKKKFGNRKIVKSKICRKLCLRGRYGAAKQSLFFSSLADANSDTLEKLQNKPDVCPFWIENPITAIEVLKAIQKLPKGKAAGPSGISFDLLKIACSSAPEIPDDLAHYFQQLIVLKINPPFELLAARLIALVKPGNGITPDGIRPIAVGESLSRLLASIVFDRVKDKASTFLNPHQFGIKTIDGASVAAIASDTFFNAEGNNFIFNLDFKNAFNSVKREAIFEVIKSDFPELSSFFFHFYGKESDLIFNSFGLKSFSGVKQGDPLGPLLFCLAIHKTLNIIKQKYPSIKIVAYMDDISLIGSFDLLELVAQEIADSYENIGLHLNASKCLLIGSSAQDLVINDSIVLFTNYSSDAFKLIGCWLGNVPRIQNELQVILEKMKIELDSISSLDIEKRIKFFMLKICYTGRIIHILRSCAPSIALDFCRSFNSLRTEFFADLLDVEPGMLKSHLFSSANLGAFLGGGKNFIFEFSRRFPDDSHLLVPNCSPHLYELSCELEELPPQIWTKCFPQSIQEIPNRSLFNLQFCCKKLQQKLSKIFESLDFDVRLGLAKKKNPAFANLLQYMCDCTSSALVTTIPQVYGTLLSDSAWTLNMRFRSFIWPDNLPHNLICKCSREITTTHLLNCKHFITFRSKVHDAVRDQLYCMCKSHRIESFLEPLLSNLFDAEDDFHKNNRGDVILPGLDGSFILLDVMSVDPCNASNERLVNSEIHNPLSNAENFKLKKYNEPLSKLASLQHAKYNLYPFVFSLFGSLSPTALRILDDFEMIVKRRTGKNFNRLFWLNRIVFSIFKGMSKMVSDALLSLGSHYKKVASSVFVLGEMDFVDVDL